MTVQTEAAAIHKMLTDVILEKIARLRPFLGDRGVRYLGLE